MITEFDLDLTYTKLQNKLFFEDTNVKYKICKKGRRAGVTRGGEQAYIEWALEDVTPMLWVDTINGNIDRYYERYFLPTLRQLPDDVDWHWNQQRKELRIHESIIDFRSADRPENIEGFGYKKIFLNEAGIILADNYLYTNAILPMLLDFSDSQLIAAGVPKGKFKKDGTKHIFYQLYERATTGVPNYKDYSFTSYDNPFLNEEDIRQLETEISCLSKDGVDQEIYAKFVETSADNPFCHQYDKTKHESELAIFNPLKQLIISVDFNLNPFAATFSHIWQDNAGFHDHQFNEMEIPNGSIPAMVDRIKAKYYNYLHAAMMTGDATGNRGDISQRDNATLYQQLLRGLGMSVTQLKSVNNPTHENSRADVNYLLANFPDFKINPKLCPVSCLQMKNTQCDAFGEIIKKDRKDVNQRADQFDTVRMKVHNFHRQWINNHQRTRSVKTNGQLTH